MAGELFINAAKISASVEVIVVPVLRRLEIYPKEVQLKLNQNLTFRAKGFDQQGDLMMPGNIIWRATNGNINSNGKFIRKTIGQVTITANLGEIYDSAFINVLTSLLDPSPIDKIDPDDEQDDEQDNDFIDPDDEQDDEQDNNFDENYFVEDTDLFRCNSIVLKDYYDYDKFFPNKIEEWFYRSQLFYYDGYSINDVLDSYSI